MLKINLKKLIVLALSLMFIVPFTTVSVNGTYADDVIKVFQGTDCIISVVDNTELKDANATDIIITAKKGDGEAVTIYENGTDKKVATYTAKFSASDDKATICFYDKGSYEIVISKKESQAKITKTISVGDTSDYVQLSYNLYKGGVLDTDKINAYKAKVQANAVKDIQAGKGSYIVPEISELISSNFPYESIRKTVYFYTVGDSNTDTNYASKADLKFSISSYGKYRFYVLFDIEKSNMNIDGGKSIKVDGFKEEKDGFYSYKLDDKELYYNKGTNEFYEKDVNEKFGYKGEAIDIEGKEVVKTLEVPIFEFEIESKKPTIEIGSKYQEDGYVGLKYTVSSIEVYGDVTYEKYELMYKATETDEFQLAEEEFDSKNLSFKPTKMGIYAIKVTAYGLNDDTPVVQYTPNIMVTEKYEEVNYKVSFSEWLSVNTVPFILLCISGLCLVAIILLLVIKPKEVVSSTIEEDR